MAHDHLSQQGRRACNCADDREGCRQLPRFQNIQFRKKARAVSLLKKGGCEVKLRARLKQMESANQDVGQSSREASLRSLSLVVDWRLARVCLCLVGSATEHLSRLSRVSFLEQGVMHVRSGPRDVVPGLLYRPRTCGFEHVNSLCRFLLVARVARKTYSSCSIV